MNTKIWLEELSFGSNFGNLRAFGSNRFWYYFLAHTFKINSSNGSRDIAKSLKISFGSSFVNLRAFGSKFWQFRFPVYAFQTKKTALDYLYPFLSFSVHNFCARSDGRTDGQTFFEKVFFFLADQEYIYMSIPISTISQISPPFWPKLAYLFSNKTGELKSNKWHFSGISAYFSVFWCTLP